MGMMVAIAIIGGFAVLFPVTGAILAKRKDERGGYALCAALAIVLLALALVK